MGLLREASKVIFSRMDNVCNMFSYTNANKGAMFALSPLDCVQLIHFVAPKPIQPSLTHTRKKPYSSSQNNAN